MAGLSWYRSNRGSWSILSTTSIIFSAQKLFAFDTCSARSLRKAFHTPACPEPASALSCLESPYKLSFSLFKSPALHHQALHQQEYHTNVAASSPSALCMLRERHSHPRSRADGLAWLLSPRSQTTEAGLQGLGCHGVVQSRIARVCRRSLAGCIRGRGQRSLQAGGRCILRHGQGVARFVLAANSATCVIMPKQFLRIYR